MDSEAGIMCWMVTTTIIMIRWWMTSLLFLLMAPEVTTLPDYTLGRQAADFQVTSVLFSQRPWAHHPLPPCKQAWRRPTCPSPVTTYVCTTWRIPSRFFICLHERCITWMDILQVTKRYSYSQIEEEHQRPQAKDKCVGLWRTWSLGSTTLRTSAVQPSADVGTFLGSRWCGAKWDLDILCHFFPMAHPMALKRPPRGWSSSFHQRCRRTFCSSCWRRQTPALQSLSWQLCIPRTAKRLWCQGGRYGWWCLSFMCTFSSWRSQIFEVPWIITFDASIFSEHRGYFFPKTVVPGSIGYTAPKQRDTTMPGAWQSVEGGRGLQGLACSANLQDWFLWAPTL